jgi:uncharacterized protein
MLKERELMEIARTAPANRLNTWIPVVLSAVCAVSLLWFGQAAPTLIPVALHGNPAVDRMVKYQLLTLALTAAYLAVVYRLRPRAFREFARLGDLNAPASPVPALGISAKDGWRKVGLNFALVITVLTAIFVYIGVLNGAMPDLTKLLSVLPLVIGLSASNAFVEEALTRFGVVVGLHGVVPNRTLYLVSAAIFGGVHYFGTPGGVIGVAMAGFLGWLLARSIVETRGVFWAWFVHFLQDVVIFSGLLVALT